MKNQNQFYVLKWGANIAEIKAKTKRKNAYIKIDIPEDLAEDLLRQIALSKDEPIREFTLSWHDKRIKDQK